MQKIRFVVIQSFLNVRFCLPFTVVHTSCTVPEEQHKKSISEVNDMANSLESLVANEDHDVAERAQAMSESILLEIQLNDLRALLQRFQDEMADALCVTPPAMASVDKIGKDPTLSSIKRYVESAGAKVRLDIELPDGTHHAFPL